MIFLILSDISLSDTYKLYLGDSQKKQVRCKVNFEQLFGTR